jgi:transposase
MKDLSSMTSKRVCGLDLGDKTSQWCEISGSDERVEMGRVRTSELALSKRFEHVAPLRIALEAGTHSPWVSRLLKLWGHEVIVANPRRVRLIGHSRRKSDRIDAQILADLASVRPRLLSPIEHGSAEAQADRAVLLSRDAVVRSRSSLISHVRGEVKSLGGRVPSCSSAAFAVKAAGAVPASLRAALDPILETIAQLTATIRTYDQQIEQLIAQRYPQARLLQQIHGVGPLTSLAYLLALGDPDRFAKSRTVGAFFGLVPAQRDSGDSTPQLRISKQGDPFVRRLLIQCAHYMLGRFGKDSDLRRTGERLLAVGGKNAKKRALVAVARKLSVVMHRLLVTGQDYVPLHAQSDPMTAAA